MIELSRYTDSELGGIPLYTFIIDKEWKIAAARAKMQEYARQKGFLEVDIAELTTAASELGYNLTFHAYSGGKLQIETVYSKHIDGLRLTSTDAGPGIRSIKDALTDGFSTNGGLGGGLPGVKRLMDEFCIESNEFGTRIECTKWRR